MRQTFDRERHADLQEEVDLGHLSAANAALAAAARDWADAHRRELAERFPTDVEKAREKGVMLDEAFAKSMNLVYSKGHLLSWGFIKAGDSENVKLWLVDSGAGTKLILDPAGDTGELVAR